MGSLMEVEESNIPTHSVCLHYNLGTRRKCREQHVCEPLCRWLSLSQERQVACWPFMSLFVVVTGLSLGSEKPQAHCSGVCVVQLPMGLSQHRAAPRTLPWGRPRKFLLITLPWWPALLLAWPTLLSTCCMPCLWEEQQLMFAV